MKYEIRFAVITLLLCSLQAKILRNNALMTKMVSHFQGNNLFSEPERTKTDRHREKHERIEMQEAHERSEKHVKERERDQPKTFDKYDTNEDPIKQPGKVLNLMQNVLCKNFPTIPCDIIMQDQTLSKLIERSIQQTVVKKMRMSQSTPATMESKHSPIFPLINSEELSNFLEVSNTGYFKEEDSPKKVKKKKKSGQQKLKSHWSHERQPKKKIKVITDTKRGTELYTGRKKMRKFYPHKVKYKDKIRRGLRFREEGKTSMSAETPDAAVGGLRSPNSNGLAYKMEPAETSLWRIDYMKHGVPSMNKFKFEDGRIRGKIAIELPAPVVTNENGIVSPHSRNEVLHPDVYIKNKFVRKSGINSEVLD